MKSLIIRSMGAAVIAVASLAATAATVTIDSVVQPDETSAMVEVTCSVADMEDGFSYYVVLSGGGGTTVTQTVSSATLTVNYEPHKMRGNLIATLYAQNGTYPNFDTAYPRIEFQSDDASYLRGVASQPDRYYFTTDTDVLSIYANAVAVQSIRYAGNETGASEAAPVYRYNSGKGSPIYYTTYNENGSRIDCKSYYYAAQSFLFRIPNAVNSVQSMQIVIGNSERTDVATFSVPCCLKVGVYGIGTDGKAASARQESTSKASYSVDVKRARVFLDSVVASKTTDGMVDFVYTVSGATDEAGSYYVEFAITNATTGAVTFIDGLKQPVTADGTYFVQTTAPEDGTMFIARLTAETAKLAQPFALVVTEVPDQMNEWWYAKIVYEDGFYYTPSHLEYTDSSLTVLTLKAKTANFVIKSLPDMRIKVVKLVYEAVDWNVVFTNSVGETVGKCNIKLKKSNGEASGNAYYLDGTSGSYEASYQTPAVTYIAPSEEEPGEDEAEEVDIGGKEGVDALKVVEIAKTATEGIWHVKVEPVLKTDVAFLAWFVASDGRIKSKAASAIGLLDAVYAEAAEVADIDDEAKTVTLAVDVGEGCVEAGRAFIRIVAE